MIEEYETLMVQIKKAADHSKCIAVEKVGETSGGKELFAVIISEDTEMFGLEYLRLQNQKRIQSVKTSELYEHEKVPIMLIASIHGNEPVGAQAIMQLVDFFSQDESCRSSQVLEHLVIIAFVCANPDGWGAGTRYNGNGFDINRDFITQSQKETQSVVRLIVDYQPMVMLDLHGYVCKYQQKIGVIEPCTKPHNPHYEYDLYEKWAIPLAVSIENKLVDQRDLFSSDRYTKMTGTFIPARDSDEGWDDYTPFSAAMYAILHGAIGCTLEAPNRHKDGILWLYCAVMAALDYVSIHMKAIAKDYFVFLKRGVEGSHSYHPYQHFPDAYLLIFDSSNPSGFIKLKNHLITNGVEIHSMNYSKQIGDRVYPAGTLVVDMRQAKAIVIQTFLWKGKNLSDGNWKMTDLCAWSLPLLWGVEAVPIYSHEVYSAVSKKIESNQLIIPRNIQSKKKKIGIVQNNGLFHKQSHQAVKAVLIDLGFDVKEFHPREMADISNLENMDALIYNGYEHSFYTAERVPEQYRAFVLESREQQAACRRSIQSFLKQGGTFIAIGAGAAKASRQVLRLTMVEVHTGGWNENAIVKVNFEPGPLSNGYKDQDIGFVYRPVWFSKTENVEVLASFADDEEGMIAGYWPEYVKAKGNPVIFMENNCKAIFIGLEVCHRLHPVYLFKLLENAISI